MMHDHESISETPATPRDRRGFLRVLTFTFSAIGAALFGIPFVGYLFGAFRKPPIKWIRLGPVDVFPMRDTRLVTFENSIRQPWDGLTANLGAYIRRINESEFLIFSMDCTHLGCPVTWFPQSGLFMCPCHGGVYYENGDHASGPPPRGLFRMPWRIHNGELEVQAPHLPTLQNTLERGVST